MVGMAIACHTQQTGGERIGQMHVPDNGKSNKGGRIEVDYSSTMVMETEVKPNHLFHNWGNDDDGETMVLHMDFFPGQVVQWKTYEEAGIPSGEEGKVIHTTLHTGIFVGCITKTSKTSHTNNILLKAMYSIVIEIQKEQIYDDCCKWLVDNLLRANRKKESPYSLVELGGARHYTKDGKTLATMAPQACQTLNPCGLCGLCGPCGPFGS